MSNQAKKTNFDPFEGWKNVMNPDMFNVFKEAAGRNAQLASQVGQSFVDSAKKCSELAMEAVQANTQCAFEGMRDVCAPQSPAEAQKKATEHMNHSMKRAQDGMRDVAQVTSGAMREVTELCSKSVNDTTSAFSQAATKK